MEAKTIRNRNDIVDTMNYALKMAGYIEDDDVRMRVENHLTDCLEDIIADFNSQGEEKL